MGRSHSAGEELDSGAKNLMAASLKDSWEMLITVAGRSKDRKGLKSNSLNWQNSLKQEWWLLEAGACSAVWPSVEHRAVKVNSCAEVAH